MDASSQTFARFRQAHSLLYAPQLLTRSAELRPIVLTESMFLERAHDILAKIESAKYQQSFIYLFLTSLLLKDKAPSVTITVKPPTETATSFSIAIKPQTLKAELSLFGEYSFHCFAPHAQSVELCWRPEEADTSRPQAMLDSHSSDSPGRRSDLLQRATMDPLPAGYFFSVLGLPDGHYQMSYHAMGCFLPVPSHAQSVYLQFDGIFAHINFHTPAPWLTFTNTLPIGLEVNLETEAFWINLPATVPLKSEESVTLPLRIWREHLKTGLNQTRLRLRGASGAVFAENDLSVELYSHAGGALPLLQVSPLELGCLKQGLDQIHLSFAITARGMGELKCMLLIQYYEEVFDFTLNGDQPEQRFQSTLFVESQKLPYSPQGKIKLKLLSNSYLANYRLCEIELPYQLLYLNKSLPALLFGRLPHGVTTSLRLQVGRSDDQPVDLNAILPTHASYLSAYRISNNTYSFRCDTRLLKPGSASQESVIITDRLSGLSTYIKAIVEIDDS